MKSAAEKYAQLSHSRLMRVVDEYDELPREEQEALRQELSQRGLELEDGGYAPDREKDVSKSKQLVTIARYRDMAEAVVARSVLESADIGCILRDENTVRMDWMWSNMIGGMRLQVEAENEEKARELLSVPVPESIDFKEQEEFRQPVCPKCGSLSVSLSDSDRKVAAVAMLTGIPVPHLRPRSEVWRCEECGCRWTDDGEDATPEA